MEKRNHEMTDKNFVTEKKKKKVFVQLTVYVFIYMGKYVPFYVTVCIPNSKNNK